MTTELVLLFALYAYLILGIFLGSDSGPIFAFKKGGPRLAAKIERNITTGANFYKKGEQARVPGWRE